MTSAVQRLSEQLMSDAIWVAVAGIIIAVAIVRLLRARTTARGFDAGSVSAQWVVQHRVKTDANDR